MPATLTVDGLIDSGFFPEVLPPCFDSTTFSAAFGPNANPPAEFVTSNGTVVPAASKCVTYHQTLVGNRSRVFSIPNPVHYYRLARCVVDNWPVIYKAARCSPLSLTKPVFRPGKPCIGPEVIFADRPAERARVRSTSRFILRADISRFFPSIYTHSIAWAFQGKAFAKSRKGDKNFIGNQLDSCFQSLQDRQTMGIPVGQIISRIVAEVILARVEKEMRVTKATVGIRCIDDYEVGFLSETDAVDFRHKLERVLATFELALNGLKTSILSLPQLLLDHWDAELREFDFGVGFVAVAGDPDVHDPINLNLIPNLLVPPKAERLLLFFNKAIDLQQKYPVDAVLRFSLMRLANLHITEDCWPLYQDYLFHCALNQPETLRVVSSNLLKAEFFDGNSVDRKRLKIIIDALVVSATPIGQSSTVVWSLWMALLFEIKLSAMATRELAQTSDCAIACLVFEMQSRSLLTRSFTASHLQSIASEPNALYSSHWLLSYEAARNGWLTSSSYLNTDPCFAYLKRSGVAFYNGASIEETKRRLSQAAEARRPVRLLRTDDSDSDDDFDLWWTRESP